MRRFASALVEARRTGRALLALQLFTRNWCLRGVPAGNLSAGKNCLPAALLPARARLYLPLATFGFAAGWFAGTLQACAVTPSLATLSCLEHKP